MIVQSLEYLIETIAESNAAAKKASERLLGPRHYKQFRQTLRTGKCDGLSSRSIARITALSDRDLLLQTEYVRDDLLLRFLPLAKSIASRIVKKVSVDYVGVSADDLSGPAAEALIDAIYGFDDSTKNFAKYARVVIKNQLFRFIRQEMQQAISSHSSQYDEIVRSGQAKAAEEVAEDIEYHDDSIADKLDVRELMNRAGFSEQDQEMLLMNASGIKHKVIAKTLGMRLSVVKEKVKTMMSILRKLDRRRAA